MLSVCNPLQQYESHYQLAHSFVCHECHRSFPNERLMDRHITERHDPFFKVLSERQPMYVPHHNAWIVDSLSGV
jgi:hypothetical protein